MLATSESLGFFKQFLIKICLYVNTIDLSLLKIIVKMHYIVLDDLDSPLDDEMNVHDNERSWQDVQKDDNSRNIEGRNLISMMYTFMV